MNRHLVTVKVRVKRRTDKRMKLDRFPFDQYGFKRLNTQTVKCWRTVQKNWVFTDHFIQNIPNLWTLFFNQFLGLFHGGRQTFGLKAAVDEWFKKLERHFLGQTTLMQFQLGTRHNHRTTREVDAFPQKVLTETALLTLQHI